MTDSVMDINQILKTLPHRYPFVLIDRVIRVEIAKSLTAIKNVTINEPYFTGHFPEHPVMPGVLVIEALAQACCILAIKTAEAAGLIPRGIYYFASIENARFKRVIIPGDQLTLDVELLKHKSDIWKFKGVASVAGDVACLTELTSARRDIT